MVFAGMTVASFDVRDDAVAVRLDPHDVRADRRQRVAVGERPGEGRREAEVAPGRPTKISRWRACGTPSHWASSSRASTR